MSEFKKRVYLFRFEFRFITQVKFSFEISYLDNGGYQRHENIVINENEDLNKTDNGLYENSEANPFGNFNTQEKEKFV